MFHIRSSVQTVWSACNKHIAQWDLTQNNRELTTQKNKLKKTKTKHGRCRLSSVFFSKEKNSGQNKYKINNSTTEKLGNKATAHETHERAEEHNQTSARYNSWITTFLWATLKTLKRTFTSARTAETRAYKTIVFLESFRRASTKDAFSPHTHSLTHSHLIKLGV